MNFIKLTGIGRDEALYVNLDHVTCVVREPAELVLREINIDKEATRLGLGPYGAFVKETPEEIFESMKINPVRS